MSCLSGSESPFPPPSLLPAFLALGPQRFPLTLLAAVQRPGVPNASNNPEKSARHTNSALYYRKTEKAQ